MTAIDLKDTDPIIEEQKYFVFSSISPKYVKNAVRVVKSKGKEKPEIDMEVITAIKFRGAFATPEAAMEHAKYLQSIDPTHNIMIGDSFKWIVLDPDLKHASDVHYYEEKLDQIMKAHEDEYKEIQKLETERRKKLVEETRNNVKVNDEKVEVKEEHTATSTEEMVKEHEEVSKSLEDNLDKLKSLIE